MAKSKKSNLKVELHPRNKFKEAYDYKALIKSCPELAAFVKLNEKQQETIDYFNPKAVKTLNKALLKHTYGITHWDIPTNYLCPPIPGRSDYIHYVADILAESNNGTIPLGNQIKVLDLGTGANVIYPIIGHREYNWSFVGSEIDNIAINSAKSIISSNKNLKDRIEIRKQTNAKDYYETIVHKNEYFDLSICNPPFYTSLEEAHGLSKRKVEQLKKESSTETVMNFGGQKNELWCEGGEARFIERMILQSKKWEKQIFWFSTLVAKENHLKRPYELLQKLEATQVKTITMNQGNKISRILAWTFFNQEEATKWAKEKWSNKLK